MGANVAKVDPRGLSDDPLHAFDQGGRRVDDVDTMLEVGGRSADRVEQDCGERDVAAQELVRPVSAGRFGAVNRVGWRIAVKGKTMDDDF